MSTDLLLVPPNSPHNVYMHNLIITTCRVIYICFSYVCVVVTMCLGTVYVFDLLVLHLYCECIAFLFFAVL